MAPEAGFPELLWTRCLAARTRRRRAGNSEVSLPVSGGDAGSQILHLGWGAEYLPLKSAVFGPWFLKDTSFCLNEFAGFFNRSHWHLTNVIIVGECVLSLGHQQPQALVSPKAPGEGPALLRPTKNVYLGKAWCPSLRSVSSLPLPTVLPEGEREERGGEGAGLVLRERRQAVLIPQQEWGVSEEWGSESPSPLP